MRRSRVLLLCLLAGASAGAAAAGATRLARPAAGASAPAGSGCLIARLGGIDISRGDADQLAGLLSPPPGRAQASRLVVDAALAHWLLRGELPAAAPHLWLASYRALLTELGRRAAGPTDLGRLAMSELARAAASLHLETGPCHAPLAGHRPADLDAR